MGDGELGKKVFFAYPPSVVRDELISRLLEQEYEVYMLKDADVTTRLVKRYPESLVFVNIDAGLSEDEWETWIRGILADPATASVGIGIVSYNADERLQKKYLMDIGIRCGFIKLKLGLEESTRILLETLRANEAKGRRKYVRASCAHDAISAVNVREGPIKATGRIFDISVVGLSCVLDPDPDLGKNVILRDVQLKLRASLVRVEMVVFGRRTHEDRTMYIMLFSPKTDSAAKDKIRSYIQIALQSEIEAESDETLKQASEE